MQISEKVKNQIIAIGLATIAATGVLVAILCNQGVINTENVNITFEKNNIPVYKDYIKWTDNIKNILEENITKNDYRNDIKKFYTLIENGSFKTIINDENKDLMLSFDENDKYKYHLLKPIVYISQFNLNEQLNTIQSIEVSFIKGGYKYFDKNWYIDNTYLTKQTKDESIAEINKIINEVNKYTETQKQIINSWNK